MTGSKTSKCHRERKAGGSSSTKTSDRLAAPDPDHDEDMKEGEKTEQDDVVIEEEYEEELDCEDDGPTDEQPANVSRYEVKCPGIWK